MIDPYLCNIHVVLILRFEMIESVEHIKPILALNTLVMVLFTMAICFTKVTYNDLIFSETKSRIPIYIMCRAFTVRIKNKSSYLGHYELQALGRVCWSVLHHDGHPGSLWRSGLHWGSLHKLQLRSYFRPHWCW